MKIAKSKFYQCKFQNGSRSSDLKKNWAVINSFTSESNKSSNINEIVLKKNTISDPKVEAKSFNNCFINIGPKLASEESR